MESIYEIGYANSTMARITKRAGMSRGAMQHHFKTRSELVLAVADHIYQELGKPFATPLNRDLPLEERVKLVISVYWDVFQGPVFLSYFGIIRGSKTEKRVYEKVSTHWKQIRQQRLAWWQSYFSDVGANIEDVRAAQKLTMAMIGGLAVQKIFEPEASVARELKALEKAVLATLRGEY